MPWSLARLRRPCGGDWWVGVGCKDMQSYCAPCSIISYDSLRCTVVPGRYCWGLDTKYKIPNTKLVAPNYEHKHWPMPFRCCKITFPSQSLSQSPRLLSTNACIDMLAMSQQSRSQIQARFWVVNVLARDEVHHSVWCLLDVPTLLVSPDSAGGGLGRARVVSGGCFFSFFRRNTKSVYSYV